MMFSIKSNILQTKNTDILTPSTPFSGSSRNSSHSSFPSLSSTSHPFSFPCFSSYFSPLLSSPSPSSSPSSSPLLSSSLSSSLSPSSSLFSSSSPLSSLSVRNALKLVKINEHQAFLALEQKYAHIMTKIVRILVWTDSMLCKLICFSLYTTVLFCCVNIPDEHL